ncbi:unnamed protein product [Urochloa humidicola]
MLDSRFVEFKLDYTKTKHLPIGSVVTSGDIAGGGHLWRFHCYPRGRKLEDNNGEHLSIFLELVSGHSRNVRAILDAFAVNRDGAPSWWCDSMRRADVYRARGAAHGRDRFVARSFLDSLYTEAGGRVTVTCGVIVVLPDGGGAPPDIGAHLGRLLDDGASSDVSFVVAGETFRAHRLVLAARSPVFKAQLRGSMADGTMDSIALRDIAADTFRIMLRFVYTDALPEDEDIGFYTMLRLLAAADRFALDRLKLVCAQILWDNVTVDTVATTLARAEMYTCPELKRKCIQFFAAKKNFKKAVLTRGFVQLGQRFPSVIDELRERVVGLRL